MTPTLTRYSPPALLHQKQPVSQPGSAVHQATLLGHNHAQVPSQDPPPRHLNPPRSSKLPYHLYSRRNHRTKYLLKIPRSKTDSKPSNIKLQSNLCSKPDLKLNHKHKSSHNPSHYGPCNSVPKQIHPSHCNHRGTSITLHQHQATTQAIHGRHLYHHYTTPLPCHTTTKHYRPMEHIHPTYHNNTPPIQPVLQVQATECFDHNTLSRLRLCPQPRPRSNACNFRSARWRACNDQKLTRLMIPQGLKRSNPGLKSGSLFLTSCPFFGRSRVTTTTALLRFPAKRSLSAMETIITIGGLSFWYLIDYQLCML